MVKPETTSGNNIPGYTTGYISLGDDPECPDTDAPMLRLLHRDDIWQVNGQDCAGGIGPSANVVEPAHQIESKLRTTKLRARHENKVKEAISHNKSPSSERHLHRAEGLA